MKGWTFGTAVLVWFLAAGELRADIWYCSYGGSSGIGSGDFTYFDPATKWDPGANTASIHGFSPPAGPATPGAVSWSVMPVGTLSDTFDPHGGAGTPTSGGPSGTLIVGPGAGSELATYSAALAVWSAATGGNLTILPMVADGGAAFNTPEPGPGNTIFGDIRIGAIGLDGAGGTLAHAFQPGTAATFPGTPTIGGDLHFDAAETWIDVVAGGTGGFDLFSVALHEFGHSLGLGHSSVAGAVMFAGLSSDVAKRTLHADDIAGITAIYGFVPEPSTVVGLLSMAAMGLVIAWRRRRR